MFIELHSQSTGNPILISCLSIESVAFDESRVRCFIQTSGVGYSGYPVIESYETVKELIRRATNVASAVTN